MGTVTESIYSGKTAIIALADVQHMERHKEGVFVITSHTRWDVKNDVWANAIWLDGPEADLFKFSWCQYRYELEAETLADLSPPVRDPNMVMGTCDCCDAQDVTVARKWVS